MRTPAGAKGGGLTPAEVETGEPVSPKFSLAILVCFNTVLVKDARYRLDGQPKAIGQLACGQLWLFLGDFQEPGNDTCGIRA